MDKKQCTVCKEVKHKSFFYKRVSAKDGRMPECITCRNLVAGINRDKRKKEREFLNQFL